MTTLSVPVPPHLEEFIKKQVKLGKAANKAAVVRHALVLLAEEEAVEAVLKAETEPTLRGDLRALAKKLK
ncbi:MAG: type II toxin-antitoxin system ParD family antitoxin [Patescibacteria group bacterium]